MESEFTEFAGLEQNRALTTRIGAATSRIDALLQQLPESLS